MNEREQAENMAEEFREQVLDLMREFAKANVKKHGQEFWLRFETPEEATAAFLKYAKEAISDDVPV